MKNIMIKLKLLLLWINEWSYYKNMFLVLGFPVTSTLPYHSRLTQFTFWKIKCAFILINRLPMSRNVNPDIYNNNIYKNSTKNEYLSMDIMNIMSVILKEHVQASLLCLPDTNKFLIGLQDVFTNMYKWESIKTLWFPRSSWLARFI